MRTPHGFPCLASIGIWVTYSLSLCVAISGTVSGWGTTSFGVTATPGADVVAIAASRFHNLALRGDGSIVYWGNGNGSTSGVPPSLSNVVAISTFERNNLALMRDGTVVGWGYNYAGEINTPLGLTNVVGIAAGMFHSLALKRDGTVVTWGLIGLPADIGLHRFVSIAAGSTHNLGLKNDFTVFAWGNNDYGECNVPLGLSNVVAVSGGNHHSMALKNDGTVAVWGDNSSGQTNIPLGLTNVVAIDAGYEHCLALRGDGTAVAWGANDSGQSVVPNPNSGFAALSGGQLHSLGIRGVITPYIVNQPLSQNALSGNTVLFSVEAISSSALTYQWRRNGMAIGGATNRWLVLTNVQTANAGDYSAVVSNNTASAVSSNAVLTVSTAGPLFSVEPISQIGWIRHGCTFRSLVFGSHPLFYQWRFNGTNISGATNSSLNLSDIQFSDDGDYSLVVSNAFGSAISSNANLRVTRIVSWGKNYLPQLTPPPQLHDVVAVSASTGAGMIVALRSNGTVVAWGDNSYGQTDIPPGLTNVISIAAGSAHIAALKSDGTVVCWGNNDEGQSTPPPDLTNAVAIATRAGHNLALRCDGTVVAWGRNNAGQASPPTNLFGIKAVACGDQTSFALRGDGTVVGWGSGGLVGTLNVPPSLSNVVSIAAGTYYSLALKEDGTTVTWGDYAGGYGIPSGLANVAVIANDPGHIVVLRNDGTVGAWGFNYLQGWMGVPSGLSNVVAVAAGENHVALLGVGPPVIARSPMDRVVQTNSSTSFSVAALGDALLRYQWQRNGISILGATNSTLTITNVQWADEGEYQVIVTNVLGGTTSSSAFLNAVDFSEILGAPNLTWTTGGDAPWFLQTTIAHDRTMAAQSGAIVGGALHQSTLQTSVTGPGTLKFWWKAATLYGCSGFNFYVNDVATSGISGDADWTEQILYLPPGNSDLRWSYINNCYYPSGAGNAWLDDVSFAPGPMLPTFSAPPTDKSISAGLNTSFTAAAFGTPPLRYQWQLNGVDLPGATNTSLTVTNVQQVKAGTYTAVVSNGYGTNIADATLTVIPSLTILSQPTNQTKLVRSATAFVVSTRGSEPFNYQWRFNGTNIDAATNSTLTLSNLAYEDSGTYQVVVSNAFGIILSSNASLTVSPTLVAAWGNNTYGQTNGVRTLANVVAVTAGLYHGLALRNDGTVATWGHNQYLQATVPADLSNVVTIASGAYHNLAVRSNGTVFAWGAGTSVSFVPHLGQSSVPAGLSNVVAVAGGLYHSVALKGDGTVIGWGSNTYGQTNTPPGLTNVIAIAAGQYHNLALRRDGTVVAWGAGTNVGANPHFGQSIVPTGLSNIVAVAAGGLHSVVLREDGTVVCWGSNTYGQTNANALLTNAVTIVAGLYHSIAVLSSGAVVAWGAGTNNNPSPHFGQSITPAGLSNAVAASGGGYHSIVLINEGSPFVVRQPWNWEVDTGGDAVLRVAALGFSPLSYQWEFNGSPIANATNAMLWQTNVPLASAGSYQCVISNALGVTRSLTSIIGVSRTRPEFEMQKMTATGFELQLTRLSGHGDIVLQASTNLLNWQTISTSPPTLGNLRLFDLQATNMPTRYYRVEER